MARHGSALFLPALALALWVGLSTRPLAVVHADTPPPTLDIWTWGRNRIGQLGGVPPSHAVPWPLHQTNQWIAVSAGDEHGLALTADGEVWAWGRNENGELGNGTTTVSMLPVKVSGLIGITMIAAGGAHSLAYRASDNTLWSWGSNSNGQLGVPLTTTGSLAPIRVTGLPALKAIAAGNSHNLVIASDGTVYSWGANARGQLGLGDTDDRATPTVVNLFGPATAVAGGSAHSVVVIGDDNEVWAWGWNVFGQLGSGVQGSPDVGSPNPQPVVGMRNVVQVSAGDAHSLALTSDGHVWGWGYNTEGQVGNGDLTPANVGILSPVLLTGITGVARIDAGGQSSMALTSDGGVWMWGSNQFGTCGVNTRTDPRVPTPVVGFAGASAISLGSKFSIALGPPKPSSGVVVMGDMGTDVSAPVRRPAIVRAFGLTDVTMLAAGFHHALALDAGHRVWAWGDDSMGQLGVQAGTTATPTLVDVPLEGAAGVAQIVARGNYSLALRSDGVVFAWGDDTYGELGLGATTAVYAPTKISSLMGIAALAAGERHALALDGNATVWAWGQNLHGELGLAPSLSPALVPAAVPQIFATTEIAAGGYHSLVIDVTGSLYAWGSGFLAQLGTGGREDAPPPAAVAIGHVVSVAAGRFHSLAVLDGGKIWAFGDSSASQLGDGSVPGVMWTPVQSNFAGTALLAVAGDYDSFALGVDGTLTAWGDDSRGQLGLANGAFPHSEPLPQLSTAPAATLAAAGLTFTVVAVK